MGNKGKNKYEELEMGGIEKRERQIKMGERE